MPIAHEQISVVIDGRSIVEVYTKGRLPPILVIRHRQASLPWRAPSEFAGRFDCLVLHGVRFQLSWFFKNA